MKEKIHWPPYVASFAVTFAAAGLGALATSRGMADYQQLQKPPFTPPPLAFPIAWCILFVLMAIAAARVWNTGRPLRRRAMKLYGVQLAFNCLWSLLFFALGLHGAALIVLVALWLLILATTLLFWSQDRPAGLMLVPYLAWVAFAGYLNLGIWMLNRPA